MKGIILAGGSGLDYILLQKEFLNSYYLCMTNL